ncbi:type III secretion system export apparatus subunit SctV [Pseudomonas matsuisoli]|uniref:EscV/YscV/HrcV family type III secretion system export apparatus protein n=1 Tax=Pseudomonas matsuisoli TaxID=1515666 RepID=A0A917PP93_9PSED|nr:type III secretion system export apparatus subunit SctV [Pseudomonas matsuisoli]GGJ85745.1 EscV/YscV/HrcV family type III secretion system export apparatus protein [Pseudomonas matsuisoli]
MKLTSLNRVAAAASRSSGVVIAAFMMMAIIMMIIPLPTVMVDLLIGLNISFSILVLFVAFYLSRAVDFSALPPVILLSTLFRLALSIATTRLILLEGDAGEIVAAFGEFVIAGEVVIGLVVFLIITVAQFLVITKGAERVAEVAARFTLDAMPGKQMSIDNDLRNGDIDQPEARRRRSLLERESQLYGAMDGAMKFVKGDAIAGLVILFVNLLGGLLIGMLKLGMPFSEAIQTYSLLTVGDGLIAQIPALLIAVAAGTVVTRVASDDHRDLGSEIVSQLGANHQALALTAAVLCIVAFIPGFPTAVFLVLGVVLAGVAYSLSRKHQASNPSAETLPESVPAEATVLQTVAEPTEDVGDVDCRVTLWISESMRETTPLSILRQEAEQARGRVMDTLGIELPRVGVRIDPAAGEGRFGVDIEGVPVCEANVPAHRVRVLDDAATLQILSIDSDEGAVLEGKQPSLWVPESQRTKLDEAGVSFQEPATVLGDYLARALTRYAAEFIGIQETRQLLSRMEGDYSELLKEAQRVTSLQKISEVFRRLLDEGISLRNMRVLLETFVEQGPRDLEVHVLSEYARAALSRHICHGHADTNRLIAAYTLARPLEDAIRQALRRNDRNQSLPEGLTRSLVSQLQALYGELRSGLAPVVMTSPDIRRYVRQLLVRNDLDVPVMCYQDLSREYAVQPLAVIELPAGYRPVSERTTAAIAAAS